MTSLVETATLSCDFHLSLCFSGPRFFCPARLHVQSVSNDPYSSCMLSRGTRILLESASEVHIFISIRLAFTLPNHETSTATRKGGDSTPQPEDNPSLAKTSNVSHKSSQDRAIYFPGSFFTLFRQSLGTSVSSASFRQNDPRVSPQIYFSTFAIFHRPLLISDGSSSRNCDNWRSVLDLWRRGSAPI
jgi:hypothetical protein